MLKNSEITIPIAVTYLIAGVSGVIIFFMMFLALLNSILGINDSGMVYLFEPDGAFAVRQMQLSLSLNESDPWGHYQYGNIYNSLGFTLLKIASWFGYNVYQVPMIAYTLRFISILAYGLMLWIFYLTLRKLQVSVSLSSICTLLFASLAKVYELAQTIHPDSLTLLFITAAIFMMVFKQDFLGLVLSTILAGLAFGTKYSGIFLAPFLPVPYLCRHVFWSKRTIPAKIGKMLGIGFVVASLFALTWIITNPSVIRDYQQVIAGIALERAHLTDLFGKATATHPERWFSSLYSQFLIPGSIILIIGMGSGLIAIVTAIRTQRTQMAAMLSGKTACSPRAASLLAIFLYASVVFGYFFFTISARAPRYMFHLLPAMIVLASVGLEKLYQAAVPSKWHPLISLALLGSVMAISSHALTQNTWFSKKLSNDFLAAGKWLMTQYPPSVKILYELHGYIPQEHFQNFRNVELVTEEAITTFAPDLVILNQKIFGQWSGRRKETGDLTGFSISSRYVTTDEALMAFRRRLCAPDQLEWRIVYEANSLVILAKK